jgi:hypothetical protein
VVGKFDVDADEAVEDPAFEDDTMGGGEELVLDALDFGCDSVPDVVDEVTTTMTTMTVKTAVTNAVTAMVFPC